MSFDTFLNQAWSDHAKDAAQVAERLAGGLAQIENDEQIPAFANLIAHVMGEHLGRWNDGVSLLQNLRTNPVFSKDGESEKAILRSISVLKLAAGDEAATASLSLSDQIRVFAIAASALSEQRQADRAQKYFRSALEKAQLGISKDDPANRALAVTGNNLACALEEKNERSPKDTELMILAAETGRKYWEIAGGWKEICWGEYRLAMSYLKAQNLQQALDHAQTCIEMAQENNAGPLEKFYGYEVLALVENARRNSVGQNRAIVHAKEFFEQLSPDDKDWCKDTFSKLTTLK